MTPQEKAVIQAAIAFVYGGPEDIARLALAVEHLPGDGVYGPSGEPQPVWMPATLRDCLAGDRMRIGQEETDVLFSNIQLWHADNSNKYQPRRWDHEELVLDLSANPGRRNYPPDMACEILCDPERAAALALQQSFPGAKPVDK